MPEPPRLYRNPDLGFHRQALPDRFSPARRSGPGAIMRSGLPAQGKVSGGVGGDGGGGPSASLAGLPPIRRTPIALRASGMLLRYRSASIMKARGAKRYKPGWEERQTQAGDCPARDRCFSFVRHPGFANRVQPNDIAP